MNMSGQMKTDDKKDVERCQNNLIDERNCSSPLNEFATKNSNNHFIPLIPCNQAPQNGPVYFIDLDNTIYPKSSGIAELMVERIELYFINYLNLPPEESKQLGARFYKDYGLAIKGLIKHFAIDPVEYDRFVDGGLPLDEILKPQEALTVLLNNLSKKGSCWVFTNAGKSHATRVLNLLQIQSYFSGIIYCDYSEENFPAKPDRMAFARAMKCAQVDDPRRCYFFDDSIGNIRSAQEVGWNVVYIDEDSQTNRHFQSSGDDINTSLEIQTVDPHDTARQDQLWYPTIKCIEDVEIVLKRQ